MTAPTPSPTPGQAPPAPKPSKPKVPKGGWPGPGSSPLPETTDPGSQGTDVFGLSPQEQNQQIYVGGMPMVVVTDPSGRRIPKPASVPGGGGMRTESALDLMKYFAKLASSSNPKDRQTWRNIQTQLIAVGAYSSPDKVRLGMWTAQDAPALLKAMRAYLQVAGPDGANQPMTFAEWLNQGSVIGGGQGFGPGGGSQVAAPQISLTDPAAIREQAVSAAQAALGRSLTKSELNKFVDQFQSAQRDFQMGSYNAQVANKEFEGSAPDLGGQALEFAEQEHPQEYANNQARNYMDAFMNWFLPQGSERGNDAPVAQV